MKAKRKVRSWWRNSITGRFSSKRWAIKHPRISEHERQSKHSR
jgi:hypothetical protein